MKTETITITTLSGKELNIHVSEGVITDALIYDLMMLVGKYERERLGITYRNEKDSFAFGKPIGMKGINIRDYMEQANYISSLFRSAEEAGIVSDTKDYGEVVDGLERNWEDESNSLLDRARGTVCKSAKIGRSGDHIAQAMKKEREDLIEKNKDIKSPYEIKKNPFLYDPITVRIDRMSPIDPDTVKVTTMVIRRADVRRAEEAQEYYSRGELDVDSFVGLMLKLEYKAKNSFLLSDKDGHEYVKFAVYM